MALGLALLLVASWLLWGPASSASAQAATGAIIVELQVTPNGDTQVFEFATSYEGSVFLSDDQSHTSALLVPGTYSIVETLPTFWQRSSASCDNCSTVDAIQVADGETVTCQFWLQDTGGTVRITAQIEPDGFDTEVQFEADFGNFAIGDLETFEVRVLKGQTYAVEALVPYGWAFLYAGCDDGGLGSFDPSFVINSGIFVNCTVFFEAAGPDPCPPGFFSETGAVPCTPAPVGTFVDESGATQAQPCPVGFTTAGEASASAAACLVAPSISIEMSTGPADADTAPGPNILVGEQVNWFYQVTNTGGFPLSDLEVTDDKGVTVSCPVSELLARANTVCTGTGIAVEGQYANIGTATASYTHGDGSVVAVSGQDPSHYFGAAPSVAISKWFADDEVVAGGAASSFDVVVTNDGNVDIGEVLVFDDVDERIGVTGVSGTAGADADSDHHAQTVEWSIPSLAVGESVTVTVVFAVDSDVSAVAPISNTATATSTYTDRVDNSKDITSTGQDTVSVALLDTDGDGVPDVDDLCQDTEADPAPDRVRNNRNWPDPTETFGCSPSQIIDAAGLGNGHAKFGISNSALASWIARVS